MSGNRCPICKRVFGPSDRIVRVVAEVVERDLEQDGTDNDYWSRIVDWDLVTKMHLACAKRAILDGYEFPYEDEIRELPLFELREIHGDLDEEAPTPLLRVVEGGLG